MASHFLLPNGTKSLTLMAGESIAVYTKGTAEVFNQVGYPNHPYAIALVGAVTDNVAVFGPYASGALIIIEADAYGAYYEQGVSPVVVAVENWQIQGDPVAVNTTGAVSAAAMFGGLVTSTTAAAVAGTVPTGTVMDAANTDFEIGDSFDWTVINTGGANAFTVTAASGHTLVGAAAVAASTSGRFRTRKTAAATYVTYRIC